MKGLTRAKGDGLWVQLRDSYFLAEGDAERLEALFASLEADYTASPRSAARGSPRAPSPRGPYPPPRSKP